MESFHPMSSTMNTVSETLDKLRLNKMDTEFRWSPEGFTTGQGKYYKPEELQIIKTFRFEGESDPDDMEIIYIIRSREGLTGYHLHGYGPYGSHEDEGSYDNFIRQVPEAGHDQQLLFIL